MVAKQDLLLSCSVARFMEEPSAVNTLALGVGERLVLGMLSASR